MTVEASKCAVARSSDSLLLYFPPQWMEALLDHLADQGFSRDLVEELILPCAAPMVPLEVPLLADVFSETPSDLLDAIEAYFASDIDAYIGSVRPFEEGGIFDDDSEVLVPFAQS